jgi:four helix bundle protein
MKYQRFEELPVWLAAIDLGVRVYEMTAAPEFKSRYSLRDQIERAAVSVSNNIAEGFERGTNQELLTFLYISRGSVGEVRSMLCLLEKMPLFRTLESEIRNLKGETESISKQLGAWMRVLRDSDLKGQRYVTEKVRHRAATKRDREEFLEKLRSSGIRNPPSGIVHPESGDAATTTPDRASPSQNGPETKHGEKVN